MLKGIREDEDAVRSLGKNVYAYKMQSLILGGVIGALGGIHLRASPSPCSPTTTRQTLTFFVYTILLLGGAATVFGPVARLDHLLGLLAFVDEFLVAGARTGLISASHHAQPAGRPGCGSCSSDSASCCW